MKCFECGGNIVQKRIDFIFYKKDKTPIFFENVPVGECIQCGEKYLAGSTSERISEILKNKRISTKKHLTIPVVKLVA